jgi:uncharacterized membrane protein
MSGWQFKCTGWPWWLVLPLAALAAWLIVRLYRLETAALSAQFRRLVLTLRASALVLLILFFLEPTLTRKTVHNVPPLVGVLVDQSGSMAVKDEGMSPGLKLGEAIALNLIPANLRPVKTNAADQAAADSALVAAATEGSPVAKGLAALNAMSRYDRAVRLAQQKVLPALQGKAQVKVFAFDTGLTPLDLDKPARLLPNRPTDYEACLAALARTWGQAYVGGLVLLSDGRQTAGGDPGPVVRSLKARGAFVTGLLVGDTGVPADAAVAEITGSSEVFRGENLLLTVRYRITETNDLDWDLVIALAGREMGRRTVRGSGHWEYETFTFAATNAGINIYQARIELAREQSADLPLVAVGSVALEVWKGVNGNRVADLVNQPAFKRTADMSTSLSRLEYANRGEQYGARIRGFLIPPQNGNYTFWICSDDGSELWVSPSGFPKDKTKVAYVTDYVPRGAWESLVSQKSAPITLKARQACYFEVLHKQGGGEDHLAVGWELPDHSMERPIPAARLAPFDDASLNRLAQHKPETARSRTNLWKEISLANNAAECSVAVNEDPIQVLLADSTPRWESRYLAAMFERDRRVHLTRRYHSVIVDDPSAALLPKNQAEWDAYDMVCLGDLDINELPPEQQRMAGSFVARRGGFLACLAGPRGLPRAFSLGAVANFLPVRVSLPGSRDPEPVTALLTTEGADHPIMQVLNDPSLNRKLWPLLPLLQWVADSVVAKPGAAVLLAAQNPAKTPIVVAHRYGAGRVFWMGTDESWRWRDRLGERIHQTFWLQVMRWGLAGRLRGQDPRLQVGLDRYLLAPGESAEFKVRVARNIGEPPVDPPDVTLTRLAEDGTPVAGCSRTIALTGLPEAPGIWRAALEAPEPGTWRLTATHHDRELQGLAEARDLVVRSENGLETLDLSGDLPNLNRLAKAGGLWAGTLDQTDALLRDLTDKLKPRHQEQREAIRFWSSYLSMTLVVALLCVEWVLRKRLGLP